MMRVTALIWACRNKCKAVVKTLLEKKADVNIVSNCGRTALVWAECCYSDINKKLVKILLKNGAIVRAQDESADATSLG